MYMGTEGPWGLPDSQRMEHVGGGFGIDSSLPLSCEVNAVKMACPALYSFHSLLPSLTALVHKTACQYEAREGGWKCGVLGRVVEACQAAFPCLGVVWGHLCDYGALGAEGGWGVWLCSGWVTSGNIVPQ